jgi:hypothetical protein
VRTTRFIAAVRLTALAGAITCLAPSAASAATSEPATLYSASWAGNGTVEIVYDQPFANDTSNHWTLDATFPLNGSLHAIASSAHIGNSVWVPTRPGPAFSLPQLGGGSSDSGQVPSSSSLTESGTYVESGNTTNWTCPAPPATHEGIQYGLVPALMESVSSSGAVSLEVGFTGQLRPADSLTCSQGSNGGGFGMDTQGMVGSPSNEDLIQFGFGGVSATPASQQLTGTNESMLATDRSIDMSCANQPPSSTCTSSWTHFVITLTLQKVCTGTITIVAGHVQDGGCNAAARPSGTRITSAKVNAKRQTAGFSFSSTGATSFKCELIPPTKKGHKQPKVRFSACASPRRYSHLKGGEYTFKVEGINALGADTHPATKTFKID